MAPPFSFRIYIIFGIIITTITIITKDEATYANLCTRLGVGAGTQLRWCHGWGREKGADRVWLAEP